MKRFTKSILFFIGIGVHFFLGCSSKAEHSVLELQFSSTHYSYYYTDTDRVHLDTLWMETHYNWVTNKLQLGNAPKLQYYKYRDRDHLESTTGRSTNGFAELGTLNFHTIGHPEGHENVHVLVLNEWGHPPALFTEGIAVALAPQAIYGFGNFREEPTWNGQKLDDIVVSLLQQQKVPHLGVLLESDAFHGLSADISYPIAGSFVCYLLKQFPLENLKRVFLGTSFFDSADRLIAVFYQAYGEQISEIWDEWQQYLVDK